MKSYQARAVRDEKLWFISISGVRGATQARTLAEIEPMARDYVSIVEVISPEDFDLIVEVVLPEAARQHLDQMAALRVEASVAQARAAEESRAAARALRDEGLTIREIGSLLGISHQRAHQLIAA